MNQLVRMTHLGTKVFKRLHRAVSLTEAGIALQGVVHSRLENIGNITAILQRQVDPRKLTVSTTVANLMLQVNHAAGKI